MAAHPRQRLRIQSAPLRYAFAVVAVGVAWTVRELFLPDAAERSPFVAFGLAILAAAFVGGFWPGILATFLSTVIAVLFYLPPTLALTLHERIDVLLLTVFVAEGVLAAGAGGILQRTLRHEEALSRHPTRVADYLARVEALRGPDASQRQPPPEPLTARELEVARLLALGLSNEELAVALSISRNTVKTHLKRIYDKLGARSRTEAVAVLLDRGLLELAGPHGR